MPYSTPWGSALTAQDVMPSANDRMDIDQKQQAMQMQKMKMQQMMQQQQEDQQFQGKLSGAFQASNAPQGSLSRAYGGGAPQGAAVGATPENIQTQGQSAMKYQPGPTEQPMDFLERGMQQARTDGDVKSYMKFQQMKTQMDTGLAKAKTVGDLIKSVGGLEKFKQLQPSLAAISPELAKIDLTGMQETPDGYTKPVMQGDKHIGDIIYMDDGKGGKKTQFLKPTESEPKTDFQNFEQGMRAKLKQSNPNASDADISLQISKAWHQQQMAEKQQSAHFKINVNQPTGDQVDTLARGIIDGTIDPNGISKRGGLQASVWGKVKEIDSKFNIVKAGGSAKFQTSQPVMQTQALLKNVSTLLDKLKEKGGKLFDTGSPVVNEPLQWAQKNILPDMMGGDKVTGFDNFRDDTIAEVERGLLNTGVLSDSKYLRAVKNLKSAQTQKQRVTAIDNIQEVVKTRLESNVEGPYSDKSKPSKKIGRFTVEVE